VRIEILLTELADPPHAPGGQRVHHRLQFAAAVGEQIGCAAVDLGTLDDPGAHQRAQALGEQRRRHPRQPAA